MQRRPRSLLRTWQGDSEDDDHQVINDAECVEAVVESDQLEVTPQSKLIRAVLQCFSFYPSFLLDCFMVPKGVCNKNAARLWKAREPSILVPICSSFFGFVMDLG